MSKCHNVRTVVRGLQLVFVTGIPTVLKITRADRDDKKVDLRYVCDFIGDLCR